MKRFQLLVFLLFAFMLRSDTIVIAADAKIRAPVKCGNIISCGQDIDLKTVIKSYSEFQASRKACNPCRAVVPAVKYNVCATPAVTRYYYFWAPPGSFKTGAAALQWLRERARDGRVVNGFQIVETDTSTAEEQHLALCSVRTTSGVSGPPTECVTVGIISKRGNWLRGTHDDIRECLMSAMLRSTGAIDIIFEIIGTPKFLDISSALVKTLQENLNLITEIDINNDSKGKPESAFIKSTAALRNSNILARGWREAIDFDLYLNQETKKIRLRGTAHALVSRQAVGNLTQYQGPSDAQKNVYSKALDSYIDNAIKSACAQYTKLDGKKISCK